MSIRYNEWIDCTDENYWQTEDDIVYIRDCAGLEYFHTRRECIYGWNVLVRNKAKFMTVRKPGVLITEIIKFLDDLFYCIDTDPEDDKTEKEMGQLDLIKEFLDILTKFSDADKAIQECCLYFKNNFNKFIGSSYGQGMKETFENFVKFVNINSKESYSYEQQ